MVSLIVKLFDMVFSNKNLITFTNYEEIEKLAEREERILLTIHDKVYDLTTYTTHPGGFKIIKASKAKDVSKAFDKFHWPEGESRKLMKKFQIGVLALVSLPYDNQKTN